MQIGKRIYYDLATGSVIQDTGEREGGVIETTEIDDFASYVALSQRVPSTVGIISLAFGELAVEFKSCTSYRVDSLTGALVFDYTPIPQPTAAEIKQQRILEKQQRIAQLQAELALLQS